MINALRVMDVVKMLAKPVLTAEVMPCRVMRSVLFVILSAQDYCKSNEPISLKLVVVIGLTSRKN